MISLDPVPQFPLGELPERFPLGDVILTPDVAAKVNLAEVDKALRRHVRGDWGEMEDEDLRLNDERIEKGGTLASIYKDSKGVKFYIITEADRSTTTVLLPEEY